jgi:hypothetical protein
LGTAPAQSPTWGKPEAIIILPADAICSDVSSLALRTRPYRARCRNSAAVERSENNDDQRSSQHRSESGCSSTPRNFIMATTRHERPHIGGY